jgi:predicted nucleic acid-binding protein
MRVYADTSFLVRLVTTEPGSVEAMAEFRRLDFPSLFYLPLHALEVENAIRQRVFHSIHTADRRQRATNLRERDAALARIEQWLERGWLSGAVPDFGEGLLRAKLLSERHTERLGCRGFDLLHVGLALELECEIFLTADRVQGDLARAEGLAATVSSGK